MNKETAAPAGHISASAIKYIAALAMLVDHIAWLFLPLDTLAAQAAHFFGRLTMPLMCFFLAEGFRKTSSREKYMARIFAFALVSQPAFAFAFGSGYTLNVLFTLLLGLLALYVCEKRPKSLASTLAVIAAVELSNFCDWPIFGVLFILIFGLEWKDAAITVRRRIMCYCAVAIVSVGAAAYSLGDSWIYAAHQLGTLAAPVLMHLYNGERGRGGAFSKWFFYVFYPAHLLILGVIAG